MRNYAAALVAVLFCSGGRLDAATAAEAAAAAAGPRRCKRLEVTSDLDSTVWHALPDEVDGRIFVPFVFVPSAVSAVLNIYVSEGNNLDSFSYVISIGASELNIAKIVKSRLEQLYKVKHMLTAFDLGTSLAFFFRLKIRQGYTTVGLYEAGGGNSDLIISYKDQDTPEPRLTHYTFSVTSKVSSVVLHQCSVPLGSRCLHFVECVDYGVTCLSDGLSATCDCDEDHVRVGDRCIENSIRVGDECQNSRQCARLGAKCRKNHARKDKLKKKKVCRCLGNFYLSSEGNCAEEKDTGLVDVTLMNNRPPIWENVNPGRSRSHLNTTRKNLPWSPQRLNDGSVKVPPHCAIDIVVGAAKSPAAGLTGQFFPFELNLRGFELGFFIQGFGVLQVQFFHSSSEGNTQVVFELRLSNYLAAFRAENRSEIIPQMTPLFSVNKKSGYLVSMDCQDDSPCWVTVMSPKETSPRLKMSVDNPWKGRKGRASPVYVGFSKLSSRSSNIFVTGMCTASRGHRCSYDGDCKKTNIDLSCRVKDVTGEADAVCLCPTGRPEWDAIKISCV